MKDTIGGLIEKTGFLGKGADEVGIEEITGAGDGCTNGSKTKGG